MGRALLEDPYIDSHHDIKHHIQFYSNCSDLIAKTTSAFDSWDIHLCSTCDLVCSTLQQPNFSQQKKLKKKHNMK